jgi:hypothetical protein
VSKQNRGTKMTIQYKKSVNIFSSLKEFSPLPWRAGHSGSIDPLFPSIWDQKQDLVGDTFGSAHRCKINTHLIVCAVNHFSELVDRLESIIFDIDNNDYRDSDKNLQLMSRFYVQANETLNRIKFHLENNGLNEEFLTKAKGEI